MRERLAVPAHQPAGGSPAAPDEQAAGERLAVLDQRAARESPTAGESPAVQEGQAGPERPPQERGRRRRAALLEAAVELLTDGGFAAVSHRAVAQRAALPLAATTYYFASRDQLLTEAFAHLVDDELRTTRDWVTQHGLMAIADHVDTDRNRQLGLWELYVHAGRDPALQQVARRWTDGCVAIVADTLHLPPDNPQVRLLYTTITALWLEHVVEQRPLEQTRTLLHTAIKTHSHPQ